MMKNTVDPMATQSGVLAALLAEKGYTGPEHVIDGKEGLAHCLGPDWKLDVLTEGLGDSWRITRCGMKAFPRSTISSPIKWKRFNSVPWREQPTSWLTPASTIRSPRKPPTTHCLM
jgi:hypothetical protein